MRDLSRDPVRAIVPKRGILMSYGTDEGLVEYLAITGRTVPDGYTAAHVRFMGSLWVDSLEALYCGVAVSPDAAFPRDLWPSAIPLRVTYAAYEAGYMWASGTDIFGSGGTQGGQVTMEKVDVLQIQYAASSDTSWIENNRYMVPMALAQLAPFICEDSGDGSCTGGAAAFIV